MTAHTNVLVGRETQCQCLWTGRELRWIEHHGRCPGHRRQRGLAVEFEGQHAADIRQAFCLHIFTEYQRESAAPAHIYGNILLAVDFVGNRRRDHAGLGGEVPEFFTGVSAIGNQLAICGALEYQVSCGAQGAAVPWAVVLNMPGFLLFHRVPGQQAALDQCADRRHVRPAGRAVSQRRRPCQYWLCRDCT